MKPSTPTHSESEGQRANQRMETLFETLLDSKDLESACKQALHFALEVSGREAGLLLVQRPQELAPFLIEHQNLGEAWADQATDPKSILRRMAQRVLKGKDSVGTDAPWLAAALTLPSKNEAQGALLIFGKHCSAEELERLNAISRPIGQVIRSERENMQMRKHARAVSALQRITASLQSNGRFNEIEDQLIQDVRRALDGENAVLVLLDENFDEPGRNWSTQNGRSRERGIHPGTEANVQPGIEVAVLEECLRSGQAICLSDIASDSRFRGRGRSGTSLVHSILCAPMSARGKTLGAIAVINKQHGTFDAQDQDLLVMICSLTAKAIYETRLMQQFKLANQDLEAVHWELLRSRNTLRTLFDSIPAALYIIDRQYRLAMINVSSAQRADENPQALIGKLCYEALYGRTSPCLECKVVETLHHGHNTERHERRWGTEEEASEWQINTYPIFDETEKVSQAIILEQDVTEKRRMESILAQSEKLAAVGQLAAGVAHEINNPLTAIIANAQILQRGLSPDDDLQESVELIARAGARATQVVRNLLDFARKEHYYLAPTDVNETIRLALALVQHELLARSITLVFEPDESIPPIKASQDRLQSIWLNLLLNAIDAIESKEGKIRFTTHLIGDEIHCTITDNGKGMTPERMERIFEPFYTTKAPGRGTGLGLSVCHRTVKQHGGQILVESQVGRGSTFTVVLPVKG